MARLLFDVSTEDRRVIETCWVSEAEGISVAWVLERWAGLVHGIELDAERSVSDPRSLTADDWIADLSERELVESAREQLSPELWSRMAPFVERVDAQFVELSEPDLQGAVPAVLRESVAGKPWWWHRIPQRGPMRNELDNYIHGTAPGLVDAQG